MKKHDYPCTQESWLTQLQTRQETIQREIKELKEVDKGLQKTITNLDNTVTRFSTLVETMIEDRKTSENQETKTIPWWYTIIAAVAVYLITRLIDIL